LIESKKPIPEEIKIKNPGYIFGCDICQDVCPHNVRPPLSSTPEFSSESGLGASLDEKHVEKILKDPALLYGTPLQRKGAFGLKDNLDSLKT
jgi:epoxyqueuosine reductase